jgi:serine acetyltransferase
MNETKPMGLFAQIKEDYITHKRDWSLPGFRAVAIHRFGNWRMRLRPKILRAPFSILYRMMFRHVRNHYGIELPYEVKLGRRVRFDHQGGVVIHGNSVIGDDCVIRQGVTLGNRRPEEHDLAPTLGQGVSVGAGAKLLGPIKIGDNAIVGANAVVLIDVPAGRTVVGIPGRLIQEKPKVENVPQLKLTEAEYA